MHSSGSQPYCSQSVHLSGSELNLFSMKSTYERFEQESMDSNLFIELLLEIFQARQLKQHLVHKKWTFIFIVDVVVVVVGLSYS